jgi:hypothetical protein
MLRCMSPFVAHSRMAVAGHGGRFGGALVAEVTRPTVDGCNNLTQPSVRCAGVRYRDLSWGWERVATAERWEL